MEKSERERRAERKERVKKKIERLLEKHPEIDFDAFMKARVVFYDRQHHTILQAPLLLLHSPTHTPPLST